jgi:hypothetical protein
MRYVLFATALTVVLLGNISFAHGQKAAERFIPIGQSPGISGTQSHIGNIKGTDAARRTITVAVAPDKSHTVAVTDRTRIWLDRSKSRLSTLNGSYGDLKAGLRVEIKHEGPPGRQHAEWIKVEVIAPGPESGSSRN